MKNKGLILFMFLGLLCEFSLLHSQSNHMLQTQATQAMHAKDWYGAVQYYSRLYQRDSSKIKLSYEYAEASRLNFDVDRALVLYKRVAAFDAAKYPLSCYWTGQLLKNKMEYKEAGKWFLKFRKLKLKNNYGYYKTKAKLELEACEMAQISLGKPSDVLLQHLDTNLNTKLSEYAPIEKENLLYFSSLKNKAANSIYEGNFSKIYKAENKNGKWEKIKALDSAINSNYLHNSNTCFSEDNKQMILSRCKNKNESEFTCELYLSHFINNKWQVAVRMDDSINKPNCSTTQPCLGRLNAKSVLFFSSDRSGGEGGMDIWYAFQNEDGSYSSAINAGKKVNSPDDEITPWFENEKQILYFSSSYHQGFGALDIFKSEFNGKTFESPQNLGYPINSSYNDLYFSINASHSKAYLSSNRTGSNFDKRLNCCNDIYVYAFPEELVKPLPVDSTELNRSKLKLLVPLTLYFHNDEPDPKTENISTHKNYEKIYKEFRDLYPVYVEQFSKGYTRNLKDKANTGIESFFTDSLEGGFDDLKKFTQLLKPLMLKGDTVKITLKGYCSPLASTNYNRKLAKRRISSVHNYFNETESGFFTKYIEGNSEEKGKLIFEEEDIGELPNSKASDDFKDKANSIYNPAAAVERKIQIIAVSFGQ